MMFLLLVGLLLLENLLDSGGYKPKWLKTPHFLSDITASPVLPAPERKIPKLSPQQKDTLAVAEPLPLADFGTDSMPGLKPLLEALRDRTAHKKIRIAYFGDSMIEGDLITQDLRSLLQATYGGGGVGWLPITSATAGFRQTVVHQFSDAWQTHHLGLYRAGMPPPGPTGYAFFLPPQTSAEVTYTAVNRKGLNTLPSPTLWLGKTNRAQSLTFRFGKSEAQVTVPPLDDYQAIPLPVAEGTQRVRLIFPAGWDATLYGMSFETDTGITVDNFAFRGNSGIPLVRMPSDLLHSIDRNHHYDLIILHYGLNVVSEKADNYDWFKRGFNRTLSYLRKAFPTSGFMVVSVSDKSCNLDGTMRTIPSLPLLVSIQEELAKNHHTAFWNLYEEMGGSGTMVKWAEADTAMANKDYTHLNFRGARWVARALYKRLLQATQTNPSITPSRIQ